MYREKTAFPADPFLFFEPEGQKYAARTGLVLV
jgi:hypothetical protein